MPPQDDSLHIDIPVRLDEVKVAFGAASLLLEGDMPTVFMHAELIADNAAEWKAKSQVVIVFHTFAGHVTLDDRAYNASRHVATGNPYKLVVAELMRKGVQIELCGVTAQENGWGNADTLPGVKINTNAMARLTQLVQQGYAKFSE